MEETKGQTEMHMTQKANKKRSLKKKWTKANLDKRRGELLHTTTERWIADFKIRLIPNFV